MIPGKLFKAAIAAAIAACVLAMPAASANAQEHGKKRWEEEFKKGGGENRRIQNREGSGPRLEHRIERHIERRVERPRIRIEGPAIQAEPRLNRTERRIRRMERRRRIQTAPVIRDATPRVRLDSSRVAKKKHHRFRYNHRHHGKRYKKRRHGFTHYYGGYWYASPFWLYSYDYDEPACGGAVSDWELHVEWCYNRYRSYREDLDSYKGYDGRWHCCISPYKY